MLIVVIPLMSLRYTVNFGVLRPSVLFLFPITIGGTWCVDTAEILILLGILFNFWLLTNVMGAYRRFAQYSLFLLLLDVPLSTPWAVFVVIVVPAVTLATCK